MQHTGLRKLLKQKAATAILGNLETLSSPGIAWKLFDVQGQSLADAATLPPDQVRVILRAADPASYRREAVPISTHPQKLAQAIVVNDEAIGILVAENKADSTEQLAAPRLSHQLDAAADLLTHLVNQVLGNRALAQETLERYREINLLYRIQQAIGAPLDLEQIASLVVNESIRVIKATAGVLLLFAPDRSTFEVHARHGPAPITKSCPHTQTVAGWVARNRQAVIANDISADPRCGPADAEARSLLCVPLTVGDTSTGALMLYDKATSAIFTASDQKLLAALASQAAIAIETAREVEARERRLKAQIHELRIEIDEMRKQRQVASITASDYFARLQQSAQEMRREFEQET